MTSALKNSYHHGDLRQSLIDGAIALMGETGISELSLRQVARRVGVSHNAPYRHFEDKEALLAAVAAQGFQSLQEAMETARQQVPAEAAKRLEAIGIAYVMFALAQPLHYRLMFGDYRCHFGKYPDLTEASQQAFLVLLTTIQEGQTTGVFSQADPMDMARVAWSLVHGQSMLALDDKLNVNPAQLAAFLQFSSKTLIHGLANHDATP
jgi:AcrR family transcriptional regulator